MFSKREHWYVEIILSKAAIKALRALPSRDAMALQDKLRQFAAAPFEPHGFVKAMTGGGVRLRHGDWRATLVIHVAKNVIFVTEIGHRREIYR